MTHHGEHLAPGEHAAHRPVDGPRRQRGDDRVATRRALGAEPATDVLDDDPHLAGIETERGGDPGAAPPRALGRVDHGQVVAVPPRRARVRLHRVVVLRGRGVGHVDGRRRVGEALLDVADERVGVEVGVDVRRCVQAGMVGPELDVVRCDPVLDLDPRRHLLRDLECGGDDRGDDLAAVRHHRRAEQASSGSSCPLACGTSPQCRTASTPGVAVAVSVAICTISPRDTVEVTGHA